MTSISNCASRIALIALASAGLAGCGSGGGGGGGGVAAVPVAAPAPAPTPNKALMILIPNGNQISVGARSPTATGNSIVTFDEDTTANTASFTVASTLANNDVEPVTSGALQGDSFNGIFPANLRFYENETTDLITVRGGDSTMGLFAVADTSGLGTTVGAFHTGDATPVGEVPTNVTATYNGFFVGTELALGGDADSVTGLFGKTEITADFGAGTINGNISDMTNDVGESRDYGLAMTGTINGNAYSGTTSFTDVGGGQAGSVSNSAMNGAFYGADAHETAGAVSIEGTTPSGTDAAVVGAFGANK